MNLTIHRGTHEIGGSCVEIDSGGYRVILDMGMPLVNSYGSRFDSKACGKMSGIELVKAGVLPDIRGLYSWDKGKRIDALFISHAHMDHYGLMSYVRGDIHCYLGEATEKLISISNIFTGNEVSTSSTVYFKNGDHVNIGPFKITPFLMDHSAFDAYAFMVEAEGKKLVYSGDFREHGRKPGTLNRFLSGVGVGADILLMEGTNIGNSKRAQKSEVSVQKELESAIGGTGKIVFVVQSSQNIDRLVSVFKAAKNQGRNLVIDFYTANVLNILSRYANLPNTLNGFEEIRVFYPRGLSTMIADKGRKDLLYSVKNRRIKREEIAQNPSKYVMLVRPSMWREFPRLGDIEGTTVIYSMWSGYLNDLSMRSFLHEIKKRKMNMISIHTSGHADIETLKALVNKMRPKNIIPIHTFKPECFPSLFSNVVSVLDGVEILI
jgi:ribonuclease J